MTRGGPSETHSSRRDGGARPRGGRDDAQLESSRKLQRAACVARTGVAARDVHCVVRARDGRAARASEDARTPSLARRHRTMPPPPPPPVTESYYPVYASGDEDQPAAARHVRGERAARGRRMASPDERVRRQTTLAFAPLLLTAHGERTNACARVERPRSSTAGGLHKSRSSRPRNARV